MSAYIFTKINLGKCPYVIIIGDDRGLWVKIPHYERNNIGYLFVK